MLSFDLKTRTIQPSFPSFNSRRISFLLDSEFPLNNFSNFPLEYSPLILTKFAVDSLPPIDALLLPILAADIVAKFIIPRSAEFGAGRIVVMVITLHPNPVGQSRPRAAMIQGVPFGARVDYS